MNGSLPEIMITICFRKRKNPALPEIDQICPENPLVIQHKSGHMGLFNTPALNALGVTENTVSPPGGKIELQNGKLTGYMEENAFFEYLKKTPQPPAEKIKKALSDAQKKYASYGIATVQDGMAVKGNAAALSVFNGLQQPFR